MAFAEPSNFSPGTSPAVMPAASLGQINVDVRPDISLNPLASLTIQSINKVSQPTDSPPAPPNVIYRKCTCSANDDLNEHILSRNAQSSASPVELSSSFMSSLTASQGSGSPLPESSKNFMESRFNSDFSDIRIHNGHQAAEMSKEINAHAFTTGNDIYFNQGRFDEHSISGKKLLAHELTHTLQQDYENKLKRFVACDQPSLSGEKCPAREKGEEENSKKGPMAFLSDPTNFYVVNFEIGHSDIKKNLKDLIYWQNAMKLMAKPGTIWNIWGLSDCDGTEKSNMAIRKARAEAIYKILPAKAKANVASIEAAAITDCLVPNHIPADRTVNRAVMIEQVQSTLDIDESESELIEVDVPEFLCGPDVTSQVAGAVDKAKTMFLGWNADQQEEACDALVSFGVGDCSWDIVELHNNAWINEQYRPPCATKGAKPTCGESVQIDTDCHHAGSSNYVIYGLMFKLCHDKVSDDYNRVAMKSFIDMYKGSGVSGVATPSSNFQASLAWAYAGYDGWPMSGSPAGDRNNCEPKCPTAYSGPPFNVHWYPNSMEETCSR
ncbi:DUF4157 domain-containing protein [Pedobacter sp. HMF7647]|uniref:DUF4157 domain-containing protein n=1 Tax=Hufsiella arboris TaxID=2695275 RepID=A0A7K1YE39_9SPHI|nr:DUF4157 domain-containing protein [Hufsiella arboris]MXV52298.1 DUF4157 domain-containing protein [Hufsiella arboris]